MALPLNNSLTQQWQMVNISVTPSTVNPGQIINVRLYNGTLLHQYYVTMLPPGAIPPTENGWAKTTDLGGFAEWALSTLSNATLGSYTINVYDGITGVFIESQSVTIAAPAPADASKASIVSVGYTPANPSVGQVLTISASVKNIGTAAGDIKVNCYKNGIYVSFYET